MDLLELLTAANKVRQALQNGEYVNALEEAIPLLRFAIEEARSGGFKSAAPGEEVADDPAAKKELAGVLAECKKLATPKGKTAKGRPPVGKLGDGNLLRLLVQILTVIGPLLK